jgi:DNA-binding LytR/AlgR family response regulator
MTAISTPLLNAFSLFGGRLQLQFSEVVFIEAQRNYTVFRCATKQAIMTSKPLKFYTPLLPEYLLRIHKSYIVNVHTITHFDGQYVYLNDGSRLPVARRRVGLVEQMLSSC